MLLVPISPGPSRRRVFLRLTVANHLKYRPGYCDVAKEFLSEGHSMVGLAGHLGVCRYTLYEWRKKFPEFDEAVSIGQAGAALWWEERLRALAMDKDAGNSASVIFGLKNRASDDWRDRTEVTGPEGGPVEMVVRREIVRPGDKDAQ